MKYHSCIICLVTFIFFTSTIGQAKTIEAYGDSITAGFLAHTNVTRVSNLSVVGDILSDMVLYGITKDPKYLVPHHAPELSWPTQVAQLLVNKRTPITVDNRAFSGATTEDLLFQVNSASTLDPTATAYFFIGHNDLCRNTQSPEVIAQQYVQEYEKAISHWSRTHQNATAYFLPVGDIHRVYELLDGYVWAKSDRDFTCNDNWQRYFPYCPFYYALHQTGDLKDFLLPRIKAMNHALASIVDTWNQQSNSNHFIYLDNLHALDYQVDFFALDCYHPSEKGQTAIAQAVYRNM